MSQHSELEDNAAKRYNHMKQRFRTRYRKYGLPPLEMPFSLAQFTNWMKSTLATGSTRCAYCDWPVTLHTLHIDHRDPIAQGGSLDLFNLAPTCCSCNQLKGQLSQAAFLELRVLLSRLNAFDAADIRGRLQSQLKLALWKQARVKQNVRVRVVPHQKHAG